MCERDDGTGFFRRGPVATSVTPSSSRVLSISSVDNLSVNTIYADTDIFGYDNFDTKREKKIVSIKTLIDSGAEGRGFLDRKFVQKYNIPTLKLERPIKVRNVDGTPNKEGEITEYTWLNMKINGKAFRERMLISGLGKQKAILGAPWLKRVNPLIDWARERILFDRFKPV